MTHHVHRLADAVMCILHNALVNAENASHCIVMSRVLMGVASGLLST